ncbi:MAG: hypothetical protein IJ416_10640 [Ruminiclostridium sp.]|nr:hypothetical protein [Ruminiclostridium sp.]
MNLKEEFNSFVSNAKREIDEHLTEEKKAEYKADLKELGGDLKTLGKNIGSEFKDFTDKRLTEEKKAEYKAAASKAADATGEAVSKLGQGIKGLFK